jgi:hypothetical protein
VFEIVCLDELVPADDRLRRIDAAVDWASCARSGAVLRGRCGAPVDRSDRHLADLLIEELDPAHRAVDRLALLERQLEP